MESKVRRLCVTLGLTVGMISSFKVFETVQQCWIVVLQVTSLDNGLKVASLETFSPKCRLGLFINAGSRHETPDRLGISHVLRNTAFLVSKAP